MIEITQPTPRNIGRRKTHNTRPIVDAVMRISTLATLFMRLRLEMDALPRLSDMLLSVFIVRHFFLCVYRLSKFCLLVELHPCQAQKGCSPSVEKIQADRREVWRFFLPKGKEYPGRTRSTDRASNHFHSRWYGNKLERRPRAGENGHQHIGTEYFEINGTEKKGMALPNPGKASLCV